MKQHFLKIDFLRGIAIILVFAYHCQENLFPGYLAGYKNGVIDSANYKNLVLNLLPSAFGWTGVPLFFIISGFLIHLGFLKNESAFQAGTFYSKRFWRIFPPYWLTLFFFAFSTGSILFYLKTSRGLCDLFLHIFTLHNLTDTTFFSINKSYWSLAVEVQLYLIYPVFLYLRKKAGIKATFYFTLAFSLILIIAGVLFNKLGTQWVFDKSAFELWFIWAAGAYYAEAYFNKKSIVKDNKGWLVFAAFMLMIAARYFEYTNYLSYHFATLAWMLFVEWLLKADTIKMNTRFSALIINVGLCSYSIYLIHQPYLKNMLNFFTVLSKNHILRVLNVIPAFFIVFLVSWALYQLIELPSIEFGKKLRGRKS